MYVGICTSERHLGENVKAVGEISLTVNNLKKFKNIWAQWQRPADHSTYYITEYTYTRTHTHCVAHTQQHRSSCRVVKQGLEGKMVRKGMIVATTMMEEINLHLKRSGRPTNNHHLKAQYNITKQVHRRIIMAPHHQHRLSLHQAEIQW